MGVNITCEGRLDDPARLPELVRECRGHCDQLGWPREDVDLPVTGQVYTLVGNEIVPTGRPGVSEGRAFMELRPIDTRVQGLVIRPPDTGPLTLTFDGGGRLVEYRALPGPFATPEMGLGISMTIAPGFWLETPGSWVSTTGAVQTHVAIVALLRWLQAHFMGGLLVYDDGEFWDSGDLDRLAARHGQMQAAIDLLRQPEAAKALLGMVGIGERPDAPDAEAGPKPAGQETAEKARLH